MPVDGRLSPILQDWYHKTRAEKPDFNPHVPGILPTRWYRALMKADLADDMWEMWYLHYVSLHLNGLFTVYSNLGAYGGVNNHSCLSINRREVGLHFRVKGREDLCRLLSTWNDEFVRFPSNVVKLDWDGRQLQ